MNHNPRQLPAASPTRRRRSHMAPFNSIALSLFNERDGACRWTGAGLGYVHGSVRQSPWLGLFDDSPIQGIFPYNTTNRTTTTAASLGDSTIYQNVSQYDVFGRLIGINQTGANITSKSVTYMYNANGQRVGSTNKQSGETVSNSAWAYDAANRVTSIQHKTATDNLFADYGFTWDAANRIAALETNDGTTDNTYDATGQLIAVDYDFIADESYEYDENGNRVTANGDTYTTGANNETLADGTYRYSFDSEGNRTEKFLWTDADEDGIIDDNEKTLVQTYEWDYRNRLTSVTNYDDLGAAESTIEYTYDYLNQMLSRSITIDSTTTTESYLYDNGQIAIQFDNTGEATTINLWGANIDELVATEQNTVNWAYGDHLNSIRDVVIYNPATETTTVINHLIYDAFGNLVSSVDPSQVNSPAIEPILVFRYTGKYFDVDTQLQNNLNRWYDSTTGKWLSVDPIGFKGGDANLYRYVYNSLKIDYSGLQTTSGPVWPDIIPDFEFSDLETEISIDFEIPSPPMNITLPWDAMPDLNKVVDPGFRYRRHRVLTDPDVRDLLIEINALLIKNNLDYTFDSESSVIMDNSIKYPGQIDYCKCKPDTNPFIVKYRDQKNQALLKLVIMHEFYHIIYDINNGRASSIGKKLTPMQWWENESSAHLLAIEKNYEVLLENISSEKVGFYCEKSNKDRLIRVYTVYAATLSLRSKNIKRPSDVLAPEKSPEELEIIKRFFKNGFQIH